MTKPTTARDRAKTRWHGNTVPIGVAAANVLDTCLRLAIEKKEIDPREIKK